MKPWERNQDGTYTHPECLHQHNIWPTAKDEKGRNLYETPAAPAVEPGGGEEDSPTSSE